MSGPALSILVVDDEPAQRQLLRAALSRDYRLTAAASGEEAVQLLKGQSYDLVITDQKMPGISGLELVQWIAENAPDSAVIILTAFGTVETAVEAMKLGARDYLTKPLKSPEELRVVVARVLRERNLQHRELLYRSETQAEFPEEIVAQSEAMKRVLVLAGQVAPTDTTVLVTGESGTGKEIVARFIHRRSPRAEQPFVAVNCAALTESLLESELFGHEKGAFTGALQMRQGRFELANGGTLFLDEIGEIGVSVQAKLLRVLQERELERVGGNRTLTVDVRVIAATNRDLRAAISERRFREDLYYRINVFPIHLPPLRERAGDILPMAEFFLRKISARLAMPPKKLSPEAMRILGEQPWPGNVRELQNSLERALIVTPGETIRPEDLPLPGTRRGESRDGVSTLAEAERANILRALELSAGDRKKTADQLGISLRKLQYRLKEYGKTRK